MIQNTNTPNFQAEVSAPPMRRAAGYASLLASLVLAACASMPPAQPEDQVRQLATERWQALVAGDFARAYVYSTVGFKAVVSAEAYKARFGAAAWYGAEVIGVNCPEAAKCIARVRIDFKNSIGSKSLNKITTHTDETWLLEDGKWAMFQTI